MASYQLQSSYDTVQVLSPTSVIDVLYCTIATGRHGAIVQYTVPKKEFQADQGAVILGLFADAVDTLLDAPFVTGATGAQDIDASGLLMDEVIFTIEYTPPTPAAGTITTTAALPVTVVVQDQSLAGLQPGGSAFDQLTTVYDQLKALAGG